MGKIHSGCFTHFFWGIAGVEQFYRGRAGGAGGTDDDAEEAHHEL